MLRFDKAMQAWGTPDFAAILKQEIAQLDADQLPLQQGLAFSSAVTSDPVTAIIHSVTDMDSVIRIKAVLLYKGLASGCSCADDPTPINDNNESCEVQLDIDKKNAEATVTLIAE